MKFIGLLTVFATFLSPQVLQGQSFEEGLNYYQQGKYSEAASVFTKLNTNKGRLFSGKSYFGMGKYLTAKTYLQEVKSTADKNIYLEAQYNLALTDFQLGQYGEALNRLYQFHDQERQTQLVTDAVQFYNDILGYLTINQRKNAFQQADEPQVKYDLIAAAFGNVNYRVAQTLYNQLQHAKIDTSGPAMQKLAKMIADSMSYAVEREYGTRPATPDGITYNIGAALPSYKTGAPEFNVSRGLYFGFVMAAEEFNQQHSDRKAFIRYQNTAANKDSAAYSMTNYAWNYNADVVLGPLFSEPAKRMAELAEQYHIPLLAPLANSDTLNTDNPYVFQANPTFSSHGKRMAEYAVKQLKMDTLAVIAEKNSLGESSAYNFRDRAEKLGARVTYFFVDDFAAKGFDLTEYTKYFTTDSAKIDSMGYHQLDGIYAPFTGQAASTLAELLLVDLEAMNSKLPVLGSQVWGNINIPEQQMGNRKIYFSESYYLDKKSQKVEQFRKRYKERFNLEPNKFAMIGYDAASFVLQTLDRVGNPALLKDALKQQPLYKGIIGDIFFGGTHVNQQIKIFNITEQGVKPVVK